MSRDQAERWVVISAAIVAGVYAYRRVTEGDTSTGKTTLKNVIGQGPPPPLGAFVTAWGFTFTVISIMATANAQLGGAFALLVAAADFLANAPAIFSDVGKHTAAAGNPTPAGSITLPGNPIIMPVPNTLHPPGFGTLTPTPPQAGAIPHPFTG